jgi:hypothetical protein
MLLAGFMCYAQVALTQRYYGTTKTFTLNDCQYQCEAPASGWVLLYNKENKLTHVEWVYKNTGEQPPFLYEEQPVESDNWTRRRRFEIINQAFSPAEKGRLKDNKLMTTLYIDSNTGKVMEVEFGFTNFGPFGTIPVSVYRQIELRLKKEVWYTPTAEGNRLNYISIHWMQKVGETRAGDLPRNPNPPKGRPASTPPTSESGKNRPIPPEGFNRTE